MKPHIKIVAKFYTCPIYTGTAAASVAREYDCHFLWEDGTTTSHLNDVSGEGVVDVLIMEAIALATEDLNCPRPARHYYQPGDL